MHRLIRNAHRIATVTEGGTLRDADIRIRSGVIEEVGQGLAAGDAEIVDASRHVVTPGLVNTHHHLFQTLTRAVPAAQDAPLFGWLRTLYPIWSRLTPDDLRVSATVGMAELALSGCTMSSDHLYLFPNGGRLDDSIEGATRIGIRFHATRGAMSIGESDGGLPPDALVEDEAAILNDCERVVAAFHDPSPSAMLRIGLAPCSPFSVSRELMRDAADLARSLAVRLHTHLAENDEDVAFSRERFGMTPGEYAEDCGWTGADVWHAHCVKLTPPEIDLFARTGTAVAHCPCSNCRLASGIAPVRAMRDAGVTVGLGVDGSASSDMGELAAEMRMAMLLQRVTGAPMSAAEALEIATAGGAAALGRPDLGRIAPGFRADLAFWDAFAVPMAGSWDPAALALAGPGRVDRLMVEGRDIVAEGRLIGLDLAPVLEEHRAAALRLMRFD